MGQETVCCPDECSPIVGGTRKRYNLKPFTDHKLTLILSVFRLPCTPHMFLNVIRLVIQRVGVNEVIN